MLFKFAFNSRTLRTTFASCLVLTGNVVAGEEMDRTIGVTVEVSAAVDVTGGVLSTTLGTNATPFSGGPSRLTHIEDTGVLLPLSQIHKAKDSETFARLYSGYIFPTLPPSRIADPWRPPYDPWNPWIPSTRAQIDLSKGTCLDGSEFVLNQTGEIVLLSTDSTRYFRNFSNSGTTFRVPGPPDVILPITVTVRALMNQSPSPIEMGRIQKLIIDWDFGIWHSKPHSVTYDVDLDQYTYDGVAIPFERGVVKRLNDEIAINYDGALLVRLHAPGVITTNSCAGVNVSVSIPTLPVSSSHGRAVPDWWRTKTYGTSALGDPSDPLQDAGFQVDLQYHPWPTSLAVEERDGKLRIQTVPDPGRTVSLKPDRDTAGYCVASVFATPGGWMGRNEITIGVSAASATPATTRYHHGFCDPVAALAVDPLLMLASSDSGNMEGYFRSYSGRPIYVFTGAFGAYVGYEELLRLKAVARMGDDAYWLGSQLDLEGNVTRTQSLFRSRMEFYPLPALTTTGYYEDLWGGLLSWDSDRGNQLNLANAQTEDDFDIRALAGASGNRIFVGFGAPLINGSALIVPINNLDQVMNDEGGTPGSLSFGEPVFLNLGGRSIRSLVRKSSGSYFILAAAPHAAANSDFRLFKWSGDPLDTPVEQYFDFGSLVGTPSTLVDDPAAENLQLLVNNEETEYYGDGIAAKDLPADELRKFRSEWIVGEPQQWTPTYLEEHTDPEPPSLPSLTGVKVEKRVLQGYAEDRTGRIVRVDFRLGNRGRYIRAKLRSKSGERFKFEKKLEEPNPQSISVRAFDNSGNVRIASGILDRNGKLKTLRYTCRRRK